MRLVSIYDFDIKSTCETLYTLLKEREERINISHRSMPTYEDHVAFVKSRPYEAWYFINTADGEIAGATYLTKHNEIGIFIFRGYRNHHFGPRAVQALMEKHGPRRYLANIAPQNWRSLGLFTEEGFTLIQHTFEKDTR